MNEEIREAITERFGPRFVSQATDNFIQTIEDNLREAGISPEQPEDFQEQVEILTCDLLSFCPKSKEKYVSF